MHIHIVSANNEAKFWLEPEIVLANNYNYIRKQLKEIQSLIEDHKNEFIVAWQRYFSC